VNKVLRLTDDPPPNVYGGAGVHVEDLSKAPAKLVPVEVRCFGDQDYTDGSLTVRGYAPWAEMKRNKL
jgi:alpha-maltose-1-phosphate synthase